MTGDHVDARNPVYLAAQAGSDADGRGRDAARGAGRGASALGRQLLMQVAPMPQTLCRTEARDGNVSVRVPLPMR